MITRQDNEIAAARVEMLRILLLEGIRNSTAVWDDPEALRLVDRVDKKIDELYNYFINQI